MTFHPQLLSKETYKFSLMSVAIKLNMLIDHLLGLSWSFLNLLGKITFKTISNSNNKNFCLCKCETLNHVLTSLEVCNMSIGTAALMCFCIWI